MSKWDRIVTVAWLIRLKGERRHPPRANRIYKRYKANIARAAKWAEADPRRVMWDGKRFWLGEVT
jgi:hypothetical protein